MIFIQQCCNGDAAIIDQAEPCRGITASVMQAGDGNEGSFIMILHQLIDGIEDAAGDITGGFEHADKGRSVAVIEVTETKFRLFDEFLDVSFAVEAL